jgi:hypothetical protein
MGKYVVATLFLYGLLCACAQAEDVDAIPKEDRSPTLNGKLLTLLSLSYAATLYDTHTTLSALGRCGDRCFEANPLTRPFAGGKYQLTTYAMGLTSVSALATYRLKKTGSRWWWVPVAATSALHIAAGIRNQTIQSQQFPR